MPAQDVDVEVSLVFGAVWAVRALELWLLSALQPEMLRQTALPPVGAAALRTGVLARTAS